MTASVITKRPTVRFLRDDEFDRLKVDDKKIYSDYQNQAEKASRFSYISTATGLISLVSLIGVGILLSNQAPTQAIDYMAPTVLAGVSGLIGLVFRIAAMRFIPKAHIVANPTLLDENKDLLCANYDLANLAEGNRAKKKSSVSKNKTNAELELKDIDTQIAELQREISQLKRQLNLPDINSIPEPKEEEAPAQELKLCKIGDFEVETDRKGKSKDIEKVLEDKDQTTFKNYENKIKKSNQFSLLATSSKLISTLTIVALGVIFSKAMKFANPILIVSEISTLIDLVVQVTSIVFNKDGKVFVVEDQCLEALNEQANINGQNMTTLGGTEAKSARETLTKTAQEAGSLRTRTSRKRTFCDALIKERDGLRALAAKLNPSPSSSPSNPSASEPSMDPTPVLTPSRKSTEKPADSRKSTDKPEGKKKKK